MTRRLSFLAVFFTIPCGLALWSLAGCSGAECGQGTVERDGECVLEVEFLECGGGEIIKDGECVDAASLCDEGTAYHEDRESCMPTFPEIECGVNTEEVDGRCVADDPIECDDYSELDPNENKCLVTDAVCGDHTAFSGDEDRCVPTEGVCTAGTYYDGSSGLCYPALGCQPGDVVVDGYCVPEAAELAEQADLEATGNTNPAFDGEPVDLGVFTVGDSVVFTGTIEEPGDLDGDGELNQHIDYFSFEADAGDWFEISVQAIRIPSVGFMVAGHETTDGEAIDMTRYSSVGTARDKARQVVVPEDGTYHVAVMPEALLMDGRLLGGDDWDYVGTIEKIAPPAAEDHNFEEKLLSGTFGRLDENYFSVVGFEPGMTTDFRLLDNPKGADPVFQIWESDTTFVEEFHGTSFPYEIPEDGEFYLVVDWTSRWSDSGLDYELSHEPFVDLAPGDSLTTSFVGSDGHSALISADWSYAEWKDIEITIEDPEGEVVADSKSVPPGETLFVHGLEDSEYIATFHNPPTYGTMEDFLFEIVIFDPPQIGDDIVVGDDGHILKIEQDNADDSTVELLVVDADSGDIVAVDALDAGDGSLLRVINIAAGTYEVRAIVDDPDDVTVTAEVVVPEEITNFNQTFSGTANEHITSEQSYYLVELDEAVVYDVVLSHIDGWGYIHLFIYGPGHELLHSEGPESTVASTQIEFDAYTTYVIRVGGEFNALSMDYDYELTFEEQ